MTSSIGQTIGAWFNHSLKATSRLAVALCEYVALMGIIQARAAPGWGCRGFLDTALNGLVEMTSSRTVMLDFPEQYRCFGDRRRLENTAATDRPERERSHFTLRQVNLGTRDPGISKRYALALLPK
ncbi:hypothetical protein SAMN06265222_11066 [Neorhodopirellula lusitana]|uniref:Transposase n=1 Tax=Neorhodopirellula lusitana TaxID=445327 RepID=A0ABY1QCP2_9BACT|nr:hypothetical protein SAMN06265222_11066 [Neorhodopirellula lusitana]